MLAGLMDYKNSSMKKMMHQNKVDPGTFSFLEPGWWALHATAITAVWIVAEKLVRNNRGHRSGQPG